MLTTRLSAVVLLLLSASACTTLPEVRHPKHGFPKDDAFVGDVKRPYSKLGLVRTKVNFPSLDPARDEKDLCRNYYNKAVKDLVKRSKDKGGDAVIDVKSVVFLEDGRQEIFATPECSDDGEEGQILAQGIAVKWRDPEAQRAEKFDDAQRAKKSDDRAESPVAPVPHKPTRAATSAGNPADPFRALEPQ